MMRPLRWDKKKSATQVLVLSRRKRKRIKRRKREIKKRKLF